MSGYSLGWAKRQTAPDATSKAVLVLLGDNADDDGFAWPSVATLARLAQKTDRTVQRALRALERASPPLLAVYDVEDKATGRTRASAYVLAVNGGQPPSADVIAAVEARVGGVLRPRATAAGGATPTTTSRGEGDTHVTLPGGGEGDTRVTGEGDTRVTPGVTPMSPLELPLEPERSEDLSHRAGADERRSPETPALGVVCDGYAEVFAAYPSSGLKRTDDVAARTAYASASSEVGHERLLAAVQAFAADAQLKRGDFGAPSLQRWLSERRYLAFADEARPAVVALPAPTAVPGLPPPPEDLRAAFVASFGEAFAVSYWPAGWLASDRVLVTRTAFARDRLRRDARAWLAGRTLSVIAAADTAASEQDAA